MTDPLSAQFDDLGSTALHQQLTAQLGERLFGVHRLDRAASGVLLFARSRIAFTPWRRRLRLSLPISFALIGLFVFLAENIATFLGAWVYPHQVEGWHWVGFGKLSSWSLLVIVSFLIVAQLKRVKAERTGER